METLRSGEREFAGDPSACDQMAANSRLPLRVGDAVGARGIAGHLELTCSRDGEGRSFLSHQSFSAPFHIGKAYWDDHSLHVQAVNPTAGFLSGDTASIDVEVEAGAALQITTPSASRIHTMNDGRATLKQRLRVAAGGWLEFNPAPLIPQSRSRYRQRTEIDIEPGGEAFFLETLAPGRVAHGEVFQFDEVDWRCDVRIGGRLVSRERFRLRPDDASLWSLKHPFPAGYFASGCLVTQRSAADAPCLEALRALNDETLWVGVSALVFGGWGLRLLAADSLAMQAGKQAVRAVLADVFPQMAGEPRGNV
jgi:urease accessory protein